jgi:hypothetical protein
MVHHYLPKQRKEQGAMREVSIDQNCAAEKDKLLLDFLDWRSNPEDLYKTSELQQEQC